MASSKSFCCQFIIRCDAFLSLLTTSKASCCSLMHYTIFLVDPHFVTQSCRDRKIKTNYTNNTEKWLSWMVAFFQMIITQLNWHMWKFQKGANFYPGITVECSCNSNLLGCACCGILCLWPFSFHYIQKIVGEGPLQLVHAVLEVWYKCCRWFL